MPPPPLPEGFRNVSNCPPLSQAQFSAPTESAEHSPGFTPRHYHPGSSEIELPLPFRRRPAMPNGTTASSGHSFLLSSTLAITSSKPPHDTAPALTHDTVAAVLSSPPRSAAAVTNKTPSPPEKKAKSATAPPPAVAAPAAVRRPAPAAVRRTGDPAVRPTIAAITLIQPQLPPFAASQSVFHRF
ncbi:proline-rich protein 36-like [Capsicum annuum]|uniref:proline-rich protein 36-like n=1 Tax=Capsicum annuum TaxID=4072 RepID=UPI001FB108F7|nr:proline-rich protein 36-like [Capsicum annuum]